MDGGSKVYEIFQRFKLPPDIGSTSTRMRRWLSLDKSDDDSEEEEELDKVENLENGVQKGEHAKTWKDPTPRTQRSILELMSKCFEDSNGSDTAAVEATLAMCPPEENVLAVEDRDHYNILHKAIIYNKVDIVQLLVVHGCDVNWVVVDKCELSKNCPHRRLGALHFACYLGRSEIVNILLQWGADFTERKRVYVSAVVDCPADSQPSALGSGRPEEVVDIVNRCGVRNPAFFSVLEDHVDILQTFVSASPKPDPSQSYLVHLACRVGSYRCLRYLLDLYPSEVNRVDSDGLHPLIMAMRHGLKYIKLLLDCGSDVRQLDNLWEEGICGLHFLIRALPYPDIKDVSFTSVLRRFVEQGSNINAQRQPSGYTCLHDMVSMVNIPHGVDILVPQKSPDEAVEHLAVYDSSMMESMELLLRCGADLSLTDSNGKTPLNTLLINGNHTVRCNSSFDSGMPPGAKDALCQKGYGLENTVKFLEMFIKYGVYVGPNRKGSTPLKDLIELICSSYFGSNQWAWQHSLEILNTDELLDCYCHIIQLLVGNGCDPNIFCDDELPPLLYLLSHITDSPYVEDYMVSPKTARSVSRLMRLLLWSGAKTECAVENRRRRSRWIGCFDLLVSVLETMQDYPHSRTQEDLLSLQILMEPILQYGARPIVFQKLLYGEMGTMNEPHDHPFVYYIASHSFIYQFMQFGALNLQYVLGGQYYNTILESLCNATEHYVLNDVMRTMHVQFSAMHEPATCNCGVACADFHNSIQRHLRFPRQLKQLCRLVILRNVHPLSPRTVDRLTLPVSLRKYIIDF